MTGNDHWLEVVVAGSREQTDALEAWLFEAGALSVTLADSVDDDELGHAVLEPMPGEVRLWDAVTLIGLFSQAEDSDSLHSALHLAALQHAMMPPAYEIRLLADQAWERAWMENFRPMQFGPRLWICPTQTEPIDPQAVTLRLDPGLAFGTGTHATTAQCLAWMGEQTFDTVQPLAGKRIIDFGCGSGVLAIVALLLGAEHAWAVDIDEQALQSTEDNATRNGVAGRLTLGQPGILDAISADVVFANILYQPLIALAATLSACVLPGGHLVVSGILEEQAAPLRMRYNDEFKFEENNASKGWAMLVARRRVDDISGSNL